ncbi:MAG: carbohydrate kinase [Verrucomicrobia bacterium]|nr:carbohydrate kinase [Verrucomicrobiota bacterium]
MPSPLFTAAVDLGATSGRVILGQWADNKLTLTEAHRFPNAYRELGGHAYWEVGTLWHEIQTGLRKAQGLLPAGAKLSSVGVDTWGCDHVLVNDAGRLVFPAHAYRDNRTQAGLAALAERGEAHLYTATGIPNVFYNTSLQLGEALARFPALKDIATRCLFLPDYFNFLLSGKMENELTIASTSQLLDVQGQEWSRTALDHFKIPPAWFTPPVLAGKKLGPVTSIPELDSAQVVVVPGHDTACAYDAMPASPDGGDLFISSGTWSLVGFENAKPLLGPEAMAARVANERTGLGGYRPLVNVVGLFLLEQTMADFKERPETAADWDSLISAAAAQPPPEILIDAADPAFTAPKSMRAAIDAHLKQRKATPPKTLAEYTRVICDSIGRGHAAAAANFEKMTGNKFRRILMVGGGSKNKLLCQATANACGIPVVSFNLEGTAVGNLTSQLVALGAVKNLATFRQLLAADLQQTSYSPA